ncbi:hypothetical protein PHMEG_00027670, partial [Phytophthora megakarya]
MRFTHLALIATTALLMNPDVACAHQSTVASVETATQTNTIDAREKKFLRLNESPDADENEERGKTSKNIILKMDDWLNEGNTHGMVKRLIANMAKGTTLERKSKKMDDLAYQYLN